MNPESEQRRAEARAGMAISLATFTMAIASALQAVLYLGSFGADARTDGFFVAFALYTTFGVFSQSLRLTAAPLVVEPHARLRSRELVRALGLVALAVVVVTGPLAGPLAGLLAPGLDPAGRAVTQAALPILGAAVALQLLGAGGATLLAVRGRFMSVALAYAAGAIGGLIAYIALVGRTGELSLGWSMLAMGVITFTIMAIETMRSGGLGERCRSASARAAAVDAGLLCGRNVVYLVFNLLFIMTLAFASGSDAGDTTVLSYGYLFASYLVAGTAMALGMSRIPEMTRQARAEQIAVVRASVPVGFRYAIMLAAPALAALIVAGAPLIGALLPQSLDADGVQTLRTFGALLAPWMVAALIVNLLLPLMFAIGRARVVNVLALPLVALHLVATAVATNDAGVEGTVAAFGLAPAIFAIVLVAIAAGPRAPGLGRELAWDAARFCTAAAVAFGLATVVTPALGGDLLEAVAAGVIGTVLYAALLPVVASRQVTVVLRALRTAAP
jgi:peptidoglycan biosynthesis protein MviN/MurJ (putative lipid II flippase)